MKVINKIKLVHVDPNKIKAGDVLYSLEMDSCYLIVESYRGNKYRILNLADNVYSTSCNSIVKLVKAKFDCKKLIKVNPDEINLVIGKY
ncbi:MULTISPECIES: hypothetical protein [unclassified Lactobacillus]|uniref:hypothetical protein n=1 Tax=unclassified Lactobacillus TaxID=2620435 RepID=UPI000EFB03B6|nr:MULTISPECIES: hypothetical protein [unclassified Lactobacillus]RMC24440.1 hypothetical protein F5ESL0247_04510 [Lactobacillus sp. ESL0247]RMC28579.1 hypothetical protein F5ESL0246_04510 [Lactobacillus sp. ESL0246]RMC31771.1 hypothetical protein F5ESL0245_04515 [Lactobacillus sp. ESL0245]